MKINNIPLIVTILSLTFLGALISRYFLYTPGLTNDVLIEEDGFEFIANHNDETDQWLYEITGKKPTGCHTIKTSILSTESNSNNKSVEILITAPSVEDNCDESDTDYYFQGRLDEERDIKFNDISIRKISETEN